MPGAGAPYVVKWPGLVGYFSDVSGFGDTKAPGEENALKHLGTVTLKRGTLEPGEAWWAQRRRAVDEVGEVRASRVLVELRDEMGNVVVTWTLEDASVTRVEGDHSQKDSGCVTVEAIDLACSAITRVLESRTD